MGGGEPFLRIEIIENVIIQTLKKYPDKSFSFSATTNGTILSKKVLAVIKKYNVSLLVSLDGPEIITNINRPHKNSRKNTYNEIIKNSNVLKNEGIDFTFRSTITAGTKNLIDYASFFESLRIGYNFAFCFDTYSVKHLDSNWDRQNLEILSESFRSLMDYYYEKFKNKETIYAYYLLEQMRRISIRACQFISCGAGQNMFAVNADQTIYNCMNFTPIPQTSVGTLNSGIDLLKNELFKPKLVDATLKCNTCNIRNLCGGGCVAEKYISSRTTGNFDSKICKLQNIIYENYLILFQRIKNLNPNLVENIANHSLIYEKI